MWVTERKRKREGEETSFREREKERKCVRYIYIYIERGEREGEDKVRGKKERGKKREEGIEEGEGGDKIGGKAMYNMMMREVEAYFAGWSRAINSSLSR